MIKYFIRTTLERKLDESISRELGEGYTLLIDTEHKPVESFIEQLSIISEYDSVLLEDDVILCKNFKSKLEKEIKKYKKFIINFFTLPNNYFNTHITDESFKFNQCTYYPKGIGKLISEKMQLIFPNNRIYGYDTVENLALRALGMPYVVVRPCLVQHKDIKSLIQKNNRQRITPYFIDYLEELNIPYEEAYKPENKQKLIDLMNEKFNNKKANED